jgi:hypothetical protein
MHDRVRHDTIDNSGTVTLRINGRLRHIGVGRMHARTHVIVPGGGGGLAEAGS